jgi:hypothetical protein
MANSQQIRDILKTTNKYLTDAQVAMVSDKSAQTFNEDAVIADIYATDGKLSPYTLIEIINKHTEKPRLCGYCLSACIPVAVRNARDPEGHEIKPQHQHTVFVAKAMMPCPNCSPRKDTAQRSIDSMTEDEKAWTWVWLYQHIREILHDRKPSEEITPEQFDVAAYYPTLSFQPYLSQTHRDVLAWIQKPTVISVPHPPHATLPSFTPIENIAEQYIALGKKRMGME